MAEISNDLIKFKNSVSPKIGNMHNITSKIQVDLASFISINNNSLTQISSNYNSSKMSTVTDAVSSLNDKCSTIIKIFGSTVEDILSNCDTLLTKIDKLEDQIVKINDQKNTLSICKTDSKKVAANQRLTELNQEFENMQNEAKSLLNKIKGMDSSVSLETSSISKVESLSTIPTGASFKLEDIVVNNKKVKCYVYRPYYNKEVGKLPVMMYMYGMDLDNNHGTEYMLNGGLGKLISDGKANPSGIVVIPYVQNGRLYESKEFRSTLAQLPFEVAKKYNGDEERVSLGGTSYGAVTAYRLVNEHPNQFSALVAVYGAEEITKAFKGLKVINYTGRGGANHTDLNYIRRQTELINKMGGEATLTEYNDTWNHTNTGTRAFGEYIKDKNGKMIPVYEEAFKYKRN